MSDGTITDHVVKHPKLTGALVSGLALLSSIGGAAADGGVHGP